MSTTTSLAMELDAQVPASDEPRPQWRLFDCEGGDALAVADPGGDAEVAEAAARPRFQAPFRRQVEMHMMSLDQLLPEGHMARVVWEFVDSLDLSPLYDAIKAVEGHAGRPPADPRILLALWLLATIEGIGSARKIARSCERDIPYMWMCGGVGVNYHMLSDFRVDHVGLLDRLLTDSVGTLLHQGLIVLDRVGQDGMRVRASAGSSSFRRKATLEKCLEEAHQQVERLREERDSDPSGCDRRTQAARERAAAERTQRVQKALEEVAEVEAKREKRKKGSGESARASTTDPDARNMKMANGGYRPAYNVQFATTAETFVIVGVDVTNCGSDAGQMTPMLQQVSERCQQPQEWLADGGFSTLEDIEEVEQAGTKVYSPVKDEEKKRANGEDPFAPREGDSPGVAAWRKRMGTPEAQTIYRERAATAEFPNAGCRNRGLQQFNVRGRLKVKAVCLLQAWANNFVRGLSLGMQFAPSGSG